MNKIFTLILVIGFAISEDLIIIGDIFMSQIANIILEIPYVYYSKYLDFAYISTLSPKEYEGYNIIFSAVDSTKNNYGSDYDLFINWDHFTFYQNIHKQLQNAKEGTKVLINLSAHAFCYNADTWINFFGKIADKYIKLNFYFTSVLN